MTARLIDADQLLAFIAFINALEPPQGEPGYSDREWALQQVRWFIEGWLAPQPTFREIERAAS